jgi:hypothetical protein
MAFAGLGSARFVRRIGSEERGPGPAGREGHESDEQETEQPGAHDPMLPQPGHERSPRVLAAGMHPNIRARAGGLFG